MARNLILLIVLVLAQVCPHPVQSQWIGEVKKVVAADREAEANFGLAVSVFGNYAIAGAPFEQLDANGENPVNHAGAAYIFEKDTYGNWTLLQKITPAERIPLQFFGYAVSLYEDVAVIGATGRNTDSAGANLLSDGGAAFIFELSSSGTWVERQKIVASDREGGSFFGLNVDIWKHHLVVGAPFESRDLNDTNQIVFSGAAYFYSRDSSGTWSETQKVIASDRSESNMAIFGWDVSIFGNNAVITAPINDLDAAGGNPLDSAGAAYIFERDSSGTWHEKQKITASDRHAVDRFGAQASISGKTVLISSPNNDLDAIGALPLHDAGAAYVFEQDAGGTWNETGKITSPNRMENGRFGESVENITGRFAIGTSDVVVAGNDTLRQAGSVYVYENDAPGTWDFIQRITASDPGVADRFGANVSLFGEDILIGAPYEDENALGTDSIYRAGSAYFFSPCSTKVVIDTTVCDSFVVPSGKWTLKKDTIVMDTIQNFLSCDSIMAIHLTINASTSSSHSITACDSYTWLGNTYSASGRYFETIPNAAGCDSAMVLNLEILSPYQVFLDTVVCGSIISPDGLELWNASGKYTDTLLAVNGCDSVVHVQLTVLEKTSPTCDTTSCIEVFPNVFTPNGDGINDRFEIIGNCTGKEMTLSIFNRWGLLVWEGTGIILYWDGFVNGKPAPNGIYYYQYLGTGTEANGSFTLLRSSP